jgi:hypothetical protein
MQSPDLQLSAFTCLPPENVDARLAPVKLFPVREGPVNSRAKDGAIRAIRGENTF